jgi:hypothetical protein
VHGHQLARRERFEEDLSQQRMTEPVGLLPDHLQDPSINSLTNQGQYVVSRDRCLSDGNQRLVRRGPPPDRTYTGQLARRLRQRVPARQQRLAQSLRRLTGQASDVLGQIAQQQLGEVRVAARPGQDINDQFLGGQSTEQLSDLFSRFHGVKPSERQLRHTWETTHVGQPPMQRMSGRPVLLTERDHHREVLPPEAGNQICKHVQG